jgi:hypothetical protein
MTYQKLSDTFRKSDPSALPAAKAAKAAKAAGSQALQAETGQLKFAKVSQAEGPGDPDTGPTLATLATLAGPEADPSLFTPAPRSGIEEWQRGVSQLEVERPPKGVPQACWQKFVANAARFLAGPFAEQAVVLGWSGPDLFGCDRDRPFARIDQLGLLWLLDDGRLLALTANTATIKRSNGSILTYRCRAGSESSKVLAWELNKASLISTARSRDR